MVNGQGARRLRYRPDAAGPAREWQSRGSHQRRAPGSRPVLQSNWWLPKASVALPEVSGCAWKSSTACHSSGAGSASQDRCGSRRDSMVRYRMRQATTAYSAKHLLRRAAVSNWSCSIRQPLLRILKNSSICQRQVYHWSFSKASAREVMGMEVSSKRWRTPPALGPWRRNRRRRLPGRPPSPGAPGAVLFGTVRSPPGWPAIFGFPWRRWRLPKSSLGRSQTRWWARPRGVFSGETSKVG
jgi:hypothetical protein